MKYFFIIYALKNLFSNKIKSFLMILIIFLVLFLTIIIKSYQIGTEHLFLNDLIFTNISPQQIIPKDEKKYTFESKDLPILINGTPRLENIILAKKINEKKNLQTFFLRGIDFKKEKKILDYEKYFIQKNKKNNENTLYIGQQLAEKNNYQLNDTLIFEYQNKQTKVIITGIFHTPNPFLNEKIMITNIGFAQKLLNCQNCLSNFQLFELPTSPLLPTLTIQTWQESMPDIVQMLSADGLVWDILLFILYILIGLSFVGMMSLQIATRKNELLNLYYLGFLRYQILILIGLESLFYFLISLFFALLFVIPLLLYWQKNPIILTGIIAENLTNIGLKPILSVKITFDIFLVPIKIIFYFMIFHFFLIFYQVQKMIK